MAAPLRDSLDLTDKVALVTGASRGIGAAIARGLAERGAKVVISSRKTEPLETVAQALAATGHEALAVPAHMGDPAAAAALIDRAVEHFGGLDILVNNAATNPALGPVAGAEPAVFDKILDVNLKGPFELARRAYPVMKARGGGAVINISSVAGLRPERQVGLYSVSKAALISLTQVLALEWGADRIRVNAICPGLIETKFSEALWSQPATLERFVRRVPLGRIGRPEDIAPLAVFLATPAADYCTGAVFTVDGGLMVS